LPALLLPLTRASHCAWLSRVSSKSITLGRVEITEQAPDWPLDIEIDMHPGLVDQTFARVQAWHFTD
jgi:hypothetical protein